MILLFVHTVFPTAVSTHPTPTLQINASGERIIMSLLKGNPLLTVSYSL